MTQPTYTLQLGDCLDVMRTMPDACIDAVVTDPPYGLSFLGENWDKSVPGVAFWREMLRLLKPGGYLVAFGGSRTYHHLATAVEAAGFKIRDQLLWLYGSGFPKSFDISKAIDNAAGAKREIVGVRNNGFVGGITYFSEEKKNFTLTAPATPEAIKWTGWGTGLKPAHEPIVLARKPLVGTVAANVLTYGTGALNIYATRLPVDVEDGSRWPANVLHDGSDPIDEIFGDAARYFYCGKATTEEREIGLQHLHPNVNCDPDAHGGNNGAKARCNNHPTVKPIAVMSWLCRLITPPDGTILDPFCGSGTTGLAAILSGFEFCGIELNDHYHEIARNRLAAWQDYYRATTGSQADPGASNPNQATLFD